MPRPAAVPSPPLPLLFLVATLVAPRLRAAEAAASAELARANASVVEATQRAERLRKGGREDLARLADELAEGRRVLVRELEGAQAAEEAAAEAESAHAAALREVDGAIAAREERRQRLARLADQAAQAEADLKEPPIVSMPKGKRTPASKSVPADAASGGHGAKKKGATK